MNRNKLIDVWFAFCALASVILAGVGIWALVRIVHFITEKS